MKVIKPAKRLKAQQNTICNISFGGRFNILSEESLAKLARLNINENDFVVVFDTTLNLTSLGKLIHKKPKGILTKKDLLSLSENVILRKATWFDRLLDKFGLL
jgi:hypothetical protein